MSTRDDSPTDGARELDLDHLAELANLPLEEQERDELEAACGDVLEAFALPDVDTVEEDVERSRTFEDVVDPCEAEIVDAILEQIPRRDGRYLQP